MALLRGSRRGAAAVPVAWVIVIVLIVAGAGVALTAALVSPRSSGPPGQLSVTDDFGRNVSVPYDPARVVAFGGSIVDLMFRLGLRSHLVGVDCYGEAYGGLSDDYSSDQIALWNLTSSMCVEVEPDFVTSMLANLTPQLILSSTIVGVAAVEQAAGELGVPVLFLQPATVGGVVVDADLLGTVFGVSSAANALGAALDAELYEAGEVTANATVFPTVLLTYDADGSGYYTYGPGTFGESLLEIAGATSISANATIAYPELTAAQVLAAQPQWIVYGTGYGLTESSYTSAPDWSDFQAVKDGNLSGINSNWLTEPDPTMILDGLPALLELFHPA